MGMSQWPLWRSGIFRNIKGIVESPKRVGKAIILSETGVGSLLALPMAIGWLDEVKAKWSWTVSHKLKLSLENTPEEIFLLSERTYIPLDPLGKFTEEDRAKLQPLDEVAKIRHDQAKMKAVTDSDDSPHVDLLKTITQWCFIILALCLVAYFFKG